MNLHAMDDGGEETRTRVNSTSLFVFTNVHSWAVDQVMEVPVGKESTCTMHRSVDHRVKTASDTQ